MPDPTFKHRLPPLCDQTPESLRQGLAALGEPAFRTQQLLDWVYAKAATEWEQMRNVPQALRAKLRERYVLCPTELVAATQAGDVTEKLLFALEDGAHIETVVIRAPQPGVGCREGRRTVCVSTQVGCAYGCKFCASGLRGWQRNLSAGEIVSQLLQVARREREAGLPAGELPFDNVVVMGMGEPLANYENLMAALRIVNADWGLHFGARRITVSTSGVVPKIRRLADEPLQFRLAVSLHGATDEVRGQIMPINRRWPLAELLSAVKSFARKHGRMVTLEYILIEDVNDSFEQAHELVKIARDLHAHVNCIPYNQVEGLPWKRPGPQRQQKFVDVLSGNGIPVTIRREKGHDIDAACGQLRLRHEGATRA